MRSTACYPRLKTLDNRAPETMNMPHLQLRQKKVQKEEERYQEVRSEAGDPCCWRSRGSSAKRERERKRGRERLYTQTLT